ncbi:MAG TPA: N-methyl-L-tryptophan oxidase [Chloroflexota bacterium]|nr:N-methyl-L-tryptophan oxidase [Chloroflexota bacterium]
MTASQKRDYEYIVIGLGGIGSGAAYWLARRAGGDVLGLEQYELGHERGASEDHSRIVRLSYDQQVYADLARFSYEAWREVERELGQPLLVLTGGHDLFPANAYVPPAGHLAGLTALGIPFERLEAAEIMRRYPQFRLDEGTIGIFQEQGGLAPAGKCIQAHLNLARAHGATLLDNTPVTAITPLDDGMEVVTPEATYRCRRLVVAADAWTNEVLAPLGVKLPLTWTQEQVAYYATPSLADFRPDRFPVWIWYDNPCFYGIPVHGEERGVKVAQDIGGREVTPRTRTFEPDQDTLARVASFMRQTLPSAMGPIVSIKTCMYTMPPDRNFVIDTLPAYPQVSLALGAAHGFKFSSIIGRVLSELAIDGATSYNVGAFAVDRPIMTMERPPRAFEDYIAKSKLWQSAAV